jgi:hypothetical protein
MPTPHQAAPPRAGRLCVAVLASGPVARHSKPVASSFVKAMGLADGLARSRCPYPAQREQIIDLVSR